MPVVTTEDVLGGKPRLEGRRISVLQVAELVLDCNEDPATVADQLAISIAEVHEALAYYYDNIEEMNKQRASREALVETLKSQSKAPETLEYSR